MNSIILSYINHYLDNFKPYKQGKWCYEDGILMNAIWQLGNNLKDNYYHSFVFKYYDEMIEESGKIKNYHLDDYNIDNILPGLGLLALKDENLKFNKAIYHLEQQLINQPRTKSGSFWHKARYPYQIWLDGIYMGQVFYVQTSIASALEDVIHQLKNVDKLLFNHDKKLYVHAYDESKQMPWANRKTGQSPNAWLRSIGWMAMALVDLEEISHHPFIQKMFNKVIESMVVYRQDNELWYQLVEYPKLVNNYEETSGNLMMAYALLKAERLGLLELKHQGLGLQIFKLVIDKKLKNNHLFDICQVAGLDSAHRDGSINYYLSEPIVKDEVKGVAPLILAFTEILKLNIKK